ncbi:MAG: alpha/beta hydrolase [Actinomycetota bacterium]
MTAVFVHGNPETDQIWGPLIDALAEQGVSDVAALSPPGFGAPAPAGWAATPAVYVQWLRDELAAIDGPIDLVGHDWGAGHVFGLLAEETGQLRSWAADCAGLLHPDYVWHDMAQVWQTPDAGEEAIGAMVSLPREERAAMFAGLGMTPDIADSLADGLTEEMGRCVLTLYRAAAQPALAELGGRVLNANRPPGLVINATDDPYVSAELGAEMARQLDAPQLTLADRGHWWMIEDPGTAAAGLAGFWAGL